ncbi:MAG: CaiB/BaiF CoA-transferase family protein [Chloroflexi bacterium]|nr:CaiB/BaiF CoA-transferase family protein [Chloroflexota bacterium]
MSALKDIKVLDFCHMAPGMFCTMMLADFGADVLRIERPVKDVLSLYAGHPALEELKKVQEGIHRAFNRNKRSIALDLSATKSLEIVHKLAKSADVIVEGFRPGVAAKLGIDYATMSKINPGIVYCSLSGYGQTGPYSQLPGHDINYIGVGGALDMIGEPGGAPVIPMNFIGDWAGGSLHGVIGILLALNARHETKKGQYVDISYTDGVASLVTLFAFNSLNFGTEYKRGSLGNDPNYTTYKTRDNKYLAIGCVEPWFWINLCKFAGREDFIGFQFDQSEKRDQVFDFFRNFFLQKDRDEWFELMKDKNIPVGKVYSVAEAFSDPQMKHRHMLEEIDLPDGSKEKAVGVAIKLSDTPGGIKSPAPVLGKHTKQVLKDLGYSSKQIEDLLQQGIIG